MKDNPIYRADVDGLRAIAVLFVVINHANDVWLPSGFVGVDVFFVISGFVVTSSILSGHHGSGWSGLAEFWRRRMLRILPALFVFTLMTSLMFATFFSGTTHVQFISALRTGIASLLGLSNLYLAIISSNYFLLDQSINPFLHTWSLGVEEQFYILFAVFFFGGARFFGPKQKVYTCGIIVLLSLLSFWIFLSGMVRHPIITYYGLHARFWELAVGALIAFFAAGRSRTSDRNLLHEIAGWLGIALVVFAAFLHGEDAISARLPIVVAVSGSALFILVGVTHVSLSAQFLSLRPTVFIGLLSYSIYLYHWPVLVFIKANLRETVFTYSGGLAVIMGLAYLSFRFIEAPMRRYSGPFLPRVLPIGATTIILNAATLLSVSTSQGVLYLGKPLNFNEWLLPFSSSYAASGAIRATECLLTDGSTIPETVPDSCFTKTKADWQGSTIFLVGDSHAYADFGMVGGLEGYDAYRAVALVHDGCAIHGAHPENSSCHNYQASLPKLIAQTVGPGDYVLLAAHFPIERPFNETQVFSLLEVVSTSVSAAGATLVIELPHIRSERSAEYCRTEWFRTDYTGCSLSLSAMEAARRHTIGRIRKLVDRLQQKVYFWDPLPFLCKGSRCAAVTTSGPVLRDQNHLSVRASRALTPHFVDFVSRLESTNQAHKQ